MQYRLTQFRRPVFFALTSIALTLAACGGGDKAETPGAHGLPNISLAGSPNGTQVGPVDPHRKSVQVPVEGRAIVAAFRAHECGQPAPDFARTMKRQVLDGLKVPDGITLYDAGIGHYTSSRCKARADARAVGVYATSPGTYELEFFGGDVVRTVRVP